MAKNALKTRVVGLSLCASGQVREKQVSMVRWVVAAWCLVSIWGCARPAVQPDTQERSAIVFAQKVLKEMSEGLEKLRVSLETTIQERGTYRIFAADFFPHNVTIADLRQNFARFCTQ